VSIDKTINEIYYEETSMSTIPKDKTFEEKVREEAVVDAETFYNSSPFSPTENAVANFKAGYLARANKDREEIALNNEIIKSGERLISSMEKEILALKEEIEKWKRCSQDNEQFWQFKRTDMLEEILRLKEIIKQLEYEIKILKMSHYPSIAEEMERLKKLIVQIRSIFPLGEYHLVEHYDKWYKDTEHLGEL
jgi:uncharacterized protein YicC (UPF0701 family)